MSDTAGGLESRANGTTQAPGNRKGCAGCWLFVWFAGTATIRLACRQVCRDIFVINDCCWRAQAIVGSATPGQVGLVYKKDPFCIKKDAEQTSK